MTRRTAWLGALLTAAMRAAPPGYVEPQTCRPCHEAVYDRYAKTPMGRSFYLPGANPDPANWNGAVYFHRASNQYFEMFQRGDQKVIRRYRMENGRRTSLLERTVTHVMGSGERALSYLHRTAEGRIFELPVSWYSQEKTWAMAPGYDRPNHAGFTRQVNHKCMFCHNGYPDVPKESARPGWDADVVFPQKLPLGIDCQRCHGPGERHSRSRRPADIVNPARLGPERSLEVCMQCHYETTTFRLPDSYRRFQRPFYSYVPGEPLGDYMVHFDHAPGTGHEEKFEIVSSAYRLRQSRCFRESGVRMTCLTCHDPHGGAPKRTSQTCAGCHDSLPRHPDRGGRECADCHMPKRRTEDVVHVVMTDHKIMRVPPPGDLRAPRREKTDPEQVYRGRVIQAYPPAPASVLYLAIAQIKEKANLIEGLPALEAALKTASPAAPEPWYEFAEALRDTGRPRDAEAAYRRSLEAGPFPHSWNNLGNLLSKAGRRNEAIEAYRKGLIHTPWDAEVRVNLALALLEENRISEASEEMEAAVRANPDSAEARANLGALLLLMGRFGAARQQLEVALALEPDHAKARANLAIALARQ